MSEYIRKLIAQGEHQRLDFKFEISDSKKIARTLAAFANTDGGRLLIGVKDNGVVAGVRSDEEYYMIEAAAQLYCKPEVKFQSKEWEIDGKLVLEVIVNRSESMKHKAPYHDDTYKIFVRVKDQNLLADPILLLYWKREQGNHPVNIMFSETELTLLRELDRKGGINLTEFQNIAGINRRTAERILVDFMLIGMIRMEQTEKETRYHLVSSKILSKMLHEGRNKV